MFATPTGKRTFDESGGGEVEEVELSLKRKVRMMWMVLRGG